jgi:hypothetical protein
VVQDEAQLFGIERFGAVDVGHGNLDNLKAHFHARHFTSGGLSTRLLAE